MKSSIGLETVFGLLYPIPPSYDIREYISITFHDNAKLLHVL